MTSLVKLLQRALRWPGAFFLRRRWLAARATTGFVLVAAIREATVVGVAQQIGVIVDQLVTMQAGDAKLADAGGIDDIATNSQRQHDGLSGGVPPHVALLAHRSDA